MATFTPQFSAELGPIKEALAEASILSVVVPPIDTYAPGAKLPFVAFATQEDEFTLDVGLWRGFITGILRSGRRFVAHDAGALMEALDRHLGVTIEELSGVVFDTRIFAHLLDPRPRSEGGTGHSLDEVVRAFHDRQAPATDKATSPEELALRARLLWEVTPPLHAAISRQGLTALADKEHKLQAVTSTMARKGVLVDRAYAEKLDRALADGATRYDAIAARYGVTSVQNPTQVAASLLAMGETLTERTKDGSTYKVDKTVLLPLADLSEEWERVGAREPNPLADAVIRGRRVHSWRASYAVPFLTQTDKDGRLHATITTLAARTGRMSLSQPPLQQLPSKDWRVRRAIIADPGNVIVAVDYTQVEMRVLAALCRDPRMLEAIMGGQDLHDFTAKNVFGEAFTTKQRTLCKQVGLGKVYGGGPDTISLQTGIPVAQVRPAMSRYDQVFPGIKEFGEQLLRDARARERFEVVNAHGRLLPMDASRPWTATNYAVQSIARDILADALVRIYEAGYGHRLLLPVHDEVIAQCPAHEAEAFAQKLRELMETEFRGVPILADAEVYGRSWGDGYGATC